MNKDYFNFEKDKDDGEEYQDFVAIELWTRGIAVHFNGSKKYQLEMGESPSGIEIKYDRLLEQTGNVFIETESLSKDGKRWVRGGITKEDNAWLYCIGNRKELYIFGKKQLQMMADKLGWFIQKGYVEKKVTPTAKGFIITPLGLNSAYCIKKLEFV